MEYFDRQKWIDEECVYLYDDMYENCCIACPYVVYSKGGCPKCEKEMFEKCGEDDGE